MSTDRGKPVHLTRGERELLVELLGREIDRLSALAPDGPLTGQAKEDGRVRKLRARQYRRLVLELQLAREEAPEALKEDLP